MRILKIYSLSNFQMCNTVLLIIVTTLSITFQWLIYFVTGSLYLWSSLSISTPPTHTPWQAPNYLWAWSFAFSPLQILHLSDIMQYLSFSGYFTSKWYNAVFTFTGYFTQDPSVLSQMARFHTFYGWIIVHCISVPYFLYPLSHQWIFRLFLFLGSHKYCCYEHESTDIFQVSVFLFFG